MSEKSTEIAVQWALTGLSVAIMLARLVMRWQRLRKFEMGDYLTMAAIFAILLRSSVENVALVYGTNQIHPTARKKHYFTPEEISRREIGAKMTMVNRVLYTVYIWLQKCVVMSIIQHLLKGLELYTTLTFYWSTIAVTFVVSVVMCFVECQPFHNYWAVFPDPGKCAAGRLQLIVFSILEMITDFMLMALPLRFLIKVQRPFMAKLRLIGLFLVGIGIIAVTLARLLMNLLKFHRSGASHHIANVELLFAAIVANGPPIYGMLNMKYGSSSQRYATGQSNRNPSNAGLGDQQLDTFRSNSTFSKQPQARLAEWSARKNDETDSHEELITGRSHPFYA
ncbi:hypothetical protein PWT90_08193 [Aphanocladium album]|nr:hypothetical protein PWT90_08193 [Aphanocladium album]